MFSFLGIYVLGRPVAIYSGSIIDVFARLGVSEEAVRSTLARMVKRGLLERHRRGRKMYFGLTPRASAILEDGRRRVWETGAVNRDWDGTWTIVGFSLPDSRRSTRHDLRSRLIWAGFGLLQNGVWIAPGVKDVAQILEPLDLGDHVTVLTARAAKPTESADLVRKAFDTDQIAARYRAFLNRWDTSDPLPSAPDDLARQLLLHTDWLQLVRQDPHLPAEHLPADWPAIRAERVFQTLARAYEPRAGVIARTVLDELAV
ncbi:MAG: PaaX family transcriptional regulator [Thermobispora bispora]|jgi:phenylacetic acid degradation operon negative regulatory protein|uniref:Transcriptional regulator, PaaX family n=2 Tax=Thermobispora bispora TaxID=2006 RepID=D6YAV6_THEBD|nr:transcriptional regulator, PaaX family [Thermobispora bispora DSM 43833]MBO2474927.1 PaaX family transcriptional regulator [Actinomycetales bacterium]MBX6167881.1 PaaX family transcriptional regulator [Thermobispora bispora]QSI49748.1 PaaX family transcriptional regulator [Thermobispora bispora]